MEATDHPGPPRCPAPRTARAHATTPHIPHLANGISFSLCFLLSPLLSPKLCSRIERSFCISEPHLVLGTQPGPSTCLVLSSARAAFEACLASPPFSGKKTEPRSNNPKRREKQEPLLPHPKSRVLIHRGGSLPSLHHPSPASSCVEKNGDALKTRAGECRYRRGGGAWERWVYVCWKVLEPRSL